MKSIRAGLRLLLLVACLAMFACPSANAVENDESPEPNPSTGLALFDKSNLVAWCIVPFDANKRTPAQRAEMLVKLGITKVAYDWRAEHVASFEEEILAYKKHGLEYFAFWGWHDDMAALIEKHDITPQFWQTCPSPPGDTQQARIEAAAKQLLPLVERAAKLNCKVGLYNHGGWGGEPANLVAVCEYLRKHHDAKHVGIVYNFHHGHAHIADFAASLKKMQPHLLCVNLNGMNDNAKPKILAIGDGKHDAAMLRTLAASGYVGPVGILDHVNSEDSEVQLRKNLRGLAKVVERLE